MGYIQFNGTPEEWDALVKKNKEKEEPKQEHCDCKRAYKEALSGICELCWDEKYSTKQETLEEAAANLADPNICKTDNWIAGAKWQQERMYSEEDMINFAEYCKGDLMKTKDLFNEYQSIQQFKNK